jgi:hypothetical protein
MASSPAEFEVRPASSDSSRLEWHLGTGGSNRQWGTGRPAMNSMEQWLKPCT